MNKKTRKTSKRRNKLGKIRRLWNRAQKWIRKIKRKSSN